MRTPKPAPGSASFESARLHYSADVLGDNSSPFRTAIESDYQIKISAFFALAREVLFDTVDIPVYLS
jgi:hypothetical protein